MNFHSEAAICADRKICESLTIVNQIANSNGQIVHAVSKIVANNISCACSSHSTLPLQTRTQQVDLQRAAEQSTFTPLSHKENLFPLLLQSPPYSFADNAILPETVDLYKVAESTFTSKGRSAE